MKSVQSHQTSTITDAKSARGAVSLGLIASCTVAATLALTAFYLSLVATSTPLEIKQRLQVDAALRLLDQKGFSREAFLLRYTVTYRGRDNWLNALTKQDNAYAATNFPFQIVTLYPDFFEKATDDTERAMVLLHEAQHLQGKDESAAYAYVWQHRAQLGWTQLSHGPTPSYVTVGQLTRENAPELFTCTDHLWSDCTEPLQ